MCKSKAQLVDVRAARRLGGRGPRHCRRSTSQRGEFQLNVDAVRQAGLGVLYERFARLKAKLEAAGWLAAERKRALPPFPRAVGIVTSPRGAALRDVLTTLRRRWPALRVIVYPTAGAGRRPRPTRSRGRSAPRTRAPRSTC